MAKADSSAPVLRTFAQNDTSAQNDTFAQNDTGSDYEQGAAAADAENLILNINY